MVCYHSLALTMSFVKGWLVPTPQMVHVFQQNVLEIITAGAFVAHE